MNLRPLRPERSALAKLSYTPSEFIDLGIRIALSERVGFYMGTIAASNSVSSVKNAGVSTWKVRCKRKTERQSTKA